MQKYCCFDKWMKLNGSFPGLFLSGGWWFHFKNRLENTNKINSPEMSMETNFHYDDDYHLEENNSN